ncbi:three-helix bundle dimerization domain-containing protein (plasmid) [Mycolicibacterium psychrotolerans]|uniref:three-helix bundle dimerization domain-containing protein n=1 Tax=Mycolicibacterium psychrotolerans TaxID=216929 RepID=UPI003D664A2D
MPKVSEGARIHDVERRLIDTYPNVAPTEVVAVIAQARQSFADSKIRDFIPVLVERRARRQISDRASDKQLAS